MEGFEQTIRGRWSSPHFDSDVNIMSRIASCRHAIGTWRRENIPNAEHRLSKLKDKDDALRASDDATTEEITEATKELHAALRAEEMFWYKKSRVLGLRQGDRNSKKFHATTKQ